MDEREEREDDRKDEWSVMKWWEREKTSVSYQAPSG
jgi:hypothetical protein